MEKQKRIVVDSNFTFLPSGTYPEEYINLTQCILYQTYYLDNIKPRLDKKDYSNFRFDNYSIGVNIDNYPLNEYWEFIPNIQIV